MIIANILLVAVFTVGSDFGGALTALGFLGLGAWARGGN